MLRILRKKWFEANATAILVTLIVTIFGPAPAQAADLNFSYVGTVDVLGSGTVGNTLTAYEGYWSPSPTSYTYQWRRDSSDIPGATSSSYTVVGDDYGSNITVAVTASRAGYVTTTSVAASYYGVSIYGRAYLSNSPAPSIDGTAQVGEYLFASTSGWDAGTTFTYQWYSNGYTIYGATGSTFQLQAAQKNQRISVIVVGNKKGYYSETESSLSTDYVKPAVPKISWTSNYGQLTGKNNLLAKADLAFGSTSPIRTWCLARGSETLDLPAGPKGVSFVDAGGASITPTSLGGGCYTSSYANIQNLRLRVDVTNWGVGSHTIFATARDAEGMISLSTATSVYVAKTAPTVTGNFTEIPAIVADSFRFSTSTTTHSVSAPVSELCVTVDGQPIPDAAEGIFKSTAGSSQSASFSKSGLSGGCFSVSGPGELAQGVVSLDSKMFANGSHEMALRVRSWDGETSWWSDPVKTSFKSKNKYVPTVTWNRSNSFVATRGSASKIGGLITANIPGAPGLLTLSTVADDGTIVKFFDSENSNAFTAAPLLQKNTNIQIEVFDEDKQSVLKELTKIYVAPLVRLAKPKIALTISTLSTAVTKTVTLGVTSSKGQVAACKASWAGGTKNFAISKGVGKVVFVPRGSGSVAVTCSAAGMVASKPVSIKY